MIRELRPSDIPLLRSWHETSGFEYTFPNFDRMEGALVLTDENDIPLAAVAAERIVQLYLWMDENLHPAAKLRIIRELHQNMTTVLCSKGYHEANAFLPPGLEKSFGRRLMKTFQWVRNWPSFARSF